MFKGVMYSLWFGNASCFCFDVFFSLMLFMRVLAFSWWGCFFNGFLMCDCLSVCFFVSLFVCSSVHPSVLLVCIVLSRPVLSSHLLVSCTVPHSFLSVTMPVCAVQFFLVLFCLVLSCSVLACAALLDPMLNYASLWNKWWCSRSSLASPKTPLHTRVDLATVQRVMHTTA